VPPLPKRRRVHSDPGQFSLLPSPRASFQLYHHHLFLLHKCTRTCVNPLLALAQRLDQDSRGWSGINGAGNQLDFQQQPEDEEVQRLRPLLITAAQTIMTELGIEADSVPFVAAEKLLRLQPGEGPQLPHYDTDDPAAAVKKISVFFYLSDCLSTHLPVLPAAEMAHLFIAEPEMDEQSEWYQDAQRMIVEKHFIARPVSSGAVAVFSTDVLHFGPHNHTSHTRYGYYLLFSFENSPNQDEQQRLPLGVGIKMKFIK
jgi:hypothetical protein